MYCNPGSDVPKVCTQNATMYWFTRHLLLFAWNVIILQTVRCFPYDCIHDKVQPKAVMTANVKYEDHFGYNSHRQKRSLDDLYKPMRIHVHYSKLGYELETPQQTRLVEIIKKTTTKISNILSVIPVKGKLLLRRSERACSRVLIEGINKNKCSHKGKIDHETCLDNFRIPPEHLEGLFIYNYTHPDPVHIVWEEGTGVENTDYILYVRSISTPKCFSTGKNVIAYAAYCQVDKNFRPIAGYINICPQLLTNQPSDDKISLIALHEFFHALGFTAELFDKYRDCSNATLTDTGELACPTWHKPVREVFRSFRIVTPQVVKLASSHYDCSTHRDINEFGPRLQLENGRPGSHWDAAFMHGSLMAPNIGLPELTKLDALTLTTFAEMGWYKVNFDFAEDNIWGQGEGCTFSNFPQCTRDSDFFCKRSEDTDETATVCHYLHQHKGLCDTNDFLHSCSLVQATSQGSCRDTANQKYAFDDNEKFQPDSRCFVATLTKAANASEAVWTARCYQHKCLNGELSVRVGASPWTSCPYGDTVRIFGYKGFLKCPRAGVLCMPAFVQPAITELPIPTTSTTRRPTISKYDTDMDTYNITISFPEVNFLWLESQSNLPLFKQRVKSIVAENMGISEQRMRQCSVYRSPGVVISFSLLPSHHPDDGPVSRVVYQRLKQFVEAGNFTVKVIDNGKVYTATSISHRPGGPTYYVPTKSNGGIIAGMVIGSLLILLIVAGIVLVVQRYYTIHSRIRPNHARTHDARALATQPPPPPGSDVDAGRIQWTHERAVSALSANDVNLEEDDLSISDFSDSL